jgi:quercetin dioxygenase-like cupin family protein
MIRQPGCLVEEHLVTIFEPANMPVVTTPNAEMRVYASPEVNGSPIAVWRTDMVPGSAGPLHSASQTQVLVVVEGTAQVSVDDVPAQLHPGAGIMLPAGAQRQVVAVGEGNLVLLVSSLPDATARTEDGEPVPIPWTR